MANHQWSMLCGKAPIDSVTNTLSLIEILEEVTVQVDPSVNLAAPMPAPALIPISFFLVSAFTRTDPAISEKCLGRASLVRPNGTAWSPAPFDIDLTQFLRVRCLLGVHGLPVQEGGIHHFLVEVETAPGQWMEVTRVPLEVKLTH